MEQFNLDKLVGLKIISAEINKGNDFIKLHTNEGLLFMNFTGECCAVCFIAHINGSEFLKGSAILSVEQTEWKTIKNDEEESITIETMGATIKTSKGTVSIETRVEHNGFYSGNVNISKDYATDLYRPTIEEDELGEFRPLEDF